MQRWVKLPQGGFLDASRVVYIGRLEAFAKLDEEGNNVGSEYSVTLASSFGREHQMKITGSKEEIATLLRTVLGQGGA